MFNINPYMNKITLTKGDTAVFKLSIDEYSLKESDELKITVKRSVNRPAVIEIKANTEGKFIFLPEDTKNVEAGIYHYDIQLTTEEGNVYTLVSSRFVLLDEIGD